MRYSALTLLLCAVVITNPLRAEEASRVTQGLQILYDFQDEGEVIHDRAQVGEPIHLKIDDPRKAKVHNGSLEVRESTIIKSEKPATRLAQAVKRTNEITVEAWLQATKLDQSGPARIVTMSRDPSSRNFTLGQEGHQWDVRLRATGTSTNGTPSVPAPKGSVTPAMLHVIYTRDRDQRGRLYVNGSQVADEKVGGNLANWDEKYHLALANEFGGDRSWLGRYYLVAIYSRALTAEEVLTNFQAGSQAATEIVQRDENAHRFEWEIAPLLAEHCLECHDPGTAEGGLVLSQKELALAGGVTGKAIIPGKPGESTLFTRVHSDDMPVERPPLSKQEKELLKTWIAEGADWTLDEIDPAIYVHGANVAQNWIRRLTRKEYVQTVQDTVGVNITDAAAELLPRELRADGFSNTAYNLNVDLKHIQAYATLADRIVDQMDVVAFAKRFSKQQKVNDNDMRDLIGKMGSWVLRGPLSDAEIVSYRGISTTVVSAGGGFPEAVAGVLEAMLQSPRFVYLIENQRGDGTRWPVSDYELANRLSYITWGTRPDEELFRLAEAGKLHGDELAGQTDRLLNDPRARERSLEFINDWLNLGRLDNLQPSPEKFPNWDPALAQLMREETLRFAEEVIWKRQRPLSALLNEQVTFLTPELAKHYRMQPQQDGFMRYDLASVPERGGLLTQGSTLTVGGDEASMVTRGLFVLHDLLRGVVKDPPPCVDTTPVPTRKGVTQRLIAEQRIADTSCGGCHKKFEPLSFGLEKFDGLGSFFEKDHYENPLRSDGEILIPGSAEIQRYETSKELMDLLAASPRVAETFTWKLAQYALGRPLGAGDVRVMKAIHEQALKNGATYQGTLRAVLQSELVISTRTEASVQ